MRIFFLLSCVFFALTQAAQAQNRSLPLWEIGAFGGFASTPAYPASTERSSRALVLPFLIYRGDVLRVDRNSIAARITHTDDYEFDIGFAGSLPAKSDEIAIRRGMPDLGTLIEFGPRFKMTLNRPTLTSQIRLEVPLRAVIEINNGARTQGVSFEPELVYENVDLSSGWGMSASGSLLFGDSKLNSYLYGVSPQFSAAKRPTYGAQAGLIATRFGLSTTKDITPDVRVFGFIRYELYAGAANRASPLFRQSSGASVGIGFTWTLSRSESRAAN